MRGELSVPPVPLDNLGNLRPQASYRKEHHEHRYRSYGIHVELLYHERGGCADLSPSMLSDSGLMTIRVASARILR